MVCVLWFFYSFARQTLNKDFPLTLFTAAAANSRVTWRLNFPFSHCLIYYLLKGLTSSNLNSRQPFQLFATEVVRHHSMKTSWSYMLFFPTFSCKTELKRQLHYIKSSNYYCFLIYNCCHQQGHTHIAGLLDRLLKHMHVPNTLNADLKG